MKRISLILVCALASLRGGAACATTLSRSPAVPNRVHEVFGLRDGLPPAGVLQALQTRDGYLWLATFDGLFRFDGVRFEAFDGARVPAFGSNRIVDLAEGSDGTLWIRSEQGHLVRLAKGVFLACDLAEGGAASCDRTSAGAPVFTTLMPDGSGALWAGTRRGLFRIEGGGLRRLAAFDPDGSIRIVRRDAERRLWVTTEKGLWAGREGSLHRVELPAGAFSRIPVTVAQDDAGTIWIGTSTGVGRWSDGRWEGVIGEPGFVDRDPRGGLWVAVMESSGSGRLLLWKKGAFAPVASSAEGDPRLLPGLQLRAGPEGELWTAWGRQLLRDGVPVVRLSGSNGNFTSVSLNREGSIWATSSSSGELHAFHPASVDTFGVAEGLPAASAGSVYEDRDGSIWTGTGEALAVLPPGASRYRIVARLPPFRTEIRTLLRDREGTFWVGSSQGLFTLHEGGLRLETAPGLGGEASVQALFEDSKGSLWVGTQTGLLRRRPAAEGGGWTAITEREGLPHPFVRAIHEQADGTLWFGSNGGGAFRYAEGRFDVVDRARGLSSDLVRAFWQAPDGRLWIATENRGLNRLDPRALDRPGRLPVETVARERGLFANGIHKIVADGFGNLWMSSNQGIFRVRRSDLEEVASGARPALASVAYTERDGMVSAEANGGAQNAGLIDRTGKIWFPTQGGLVRLDPARLLAPHEAPAVHVEGLRTGSVEIPIPPGPIRLRPDQRSFSFELSAPSFLAPERQRFRFRLFPYQKDWVEAGGERQAFYTKVPPGKYRFEVLASGPGGEWSRRPAAVAVEVEPRFHETGIFYGALLLAAAAAIAAAVRVEGRRRRQRQRELERMVEERTATIARQAERLRQLDELRADFFANVSHEFRTPLTLLLGPLEDALEGRFGALRPELAAQLEVAGRNARRLLGLVDQLLDVAKLDAGGLQLDWRFGDLAAYVRRRVEAFLTLAERRGIDLTLVCAAEPVGVWFDPAQMEKVLANLLSNALKFTPRGGSVRISVGFVEEAGGRLAEVVVLDDGPGIPPEELERVFDRFHQVQASSHRWPGVGIGLALARQIVELHQGAIAVANAPGHGAVFTLRLRAGSDHVAPERVAAGLAVEETRPLPSLFPGARAEAPAEDEAEGGGAVAAADDPRTTVLVVDDNAEIRSFVRRHLEPEYRVVEAADGEEGLARARQWTPDLVVSDVMMPGLDGEGLFRRLRGDPELEQVPVILVTAKASPEDRLQGLREGVDDYLVKPFDPRELKARVDNLIAARRRLLKRPEAAPRPLRVSEVEVTPADEAFLRRVQSIVEARLDDTDLSVEALAGEVGCDRSYLLRRLRALTGETPSDLIRSLRLQRAEQLLRGGAGAVSEIAYSVGFKSVAHFSNAFQARYGERPSSFGARHRRP